MNDTALLGPKAPTAVITALAVVMTRPAIQPGRNGRVRCVPVCSDVFTVFAHGHTPRRGAVPVKLTEGEALARLAGHDHGILATVHLKRGVDAVPVVYAVNDDGHLGVPIDRVKPKSSPRLQRQRNLEADPRATLLVEHWDRHDWSQLWWVRAELRYEPGATNSSITNDTATNDTATDLAARLADRYPQYRDRPFEQILVFWISGVTGWAAQDG